MSKFTIKDFRELYPDDAACLKSLFDLHHGDNKPCEKCGSTGSYKPVKGRKSYQCGKCRNQFYPMKNSIYIKSRTPLTLWFYAMFLFVKSKNGVSACEIQRQIGVTYKTAYRMLMCFRKSMIQPDDILTGTIECDETFVGGKNINRHADKKVKHSQGRSFKDKTPVFGMFERESKQMRAIVVPDTSRFSIQPLIFKNVEQGARIMTDEWTAYQGLNQYYEHESVDHRSKEYCRGDITTNRIENAWSSLKRALKGSYIQVSRRHLQKYVDEVVFRFNNRENPLIFHDLLTSSFLTRLSEEHQNPL